MRIIKRKRLSSNENLQAQIDSSEASGENDQTKTKKQTQSTENSNLINENNPYLRVDLSDPLINQIYNQQQLLYQHASASFMMPPPPIPPLQQSILTPQQQLYAQSLDYARLIASQTPVYRLNDISNNKITHRPTTQSNNSTSQLISNNPGGQNLDPKDIFGNLPKPTTIDHLNTSQTQPLTAAKHSSYYCLTPASSTTSLQDLNNSSSLVHYDTLASNQNNKKLKTTITKKRTSKQIQSEHSTETPSQATAETTKRKRGRPPKSTQPTIVNQPPLTIAPAPKSGVECALQNVSNNNFASNNKLIKSFLTKTPNSPNLQRSKTSDNQTQQQSQINIKPIIQEEQSSKSPLPNLNWANANDLWKVMRLKDSKFKHDHLYLKRHSSIESHMRAILLDWLIEIAHAYRLHRETLHLSLEYMDRFMSLCKQEMKVDRLQLIGMTALFLASKVEEIYPPKLKELASHMENYSNNNEEAISQFELFMLKTLNWEISPVTCNTWLMTYLQIASINFHSYLSGDMQPIDLTKEHNTHIVMPLHVYKNSSSNPKEQVSPKQQQFYLQNYMKAITLLDLCLFDMESLKFNYSILAAAAMYHTLAKSVNLNSNQLVLNLVQLCSGYKINELDSCIKWMHPYADVCREILTDEKMCQIKHFSSVDQEDSHNIQLYYANMDLLKEAQLRKTPSKFYSNMNNTNSSMLTPPESNRKNQTSGVV